MEHWPARELKNQYDPAEMIDAIIRVLTEEKPPFRTVLPATHIDRIRAERDDAWKWTV